MSAELRQELVETAAAIAAAGLSPGQSGNISVRVGETIYASPTNSSFASLDAEAA